MVRQFEWDSMKAASNVEKHKVGFVEASGVFQDPHAISVADPKHSWVESRFVLLGRSAGHRLLVVCYTERPPRIRIISARPASRRERTVYATR